MTINTLKCPYSNDAVHKINKKETNVDEYIVQELYSTSEREQNERIKLIELFNKYAEGDAYAILSVP